LFVGVRGGARLIERIGIDKANTLISCVRVLLVVRGRL
jgi:hypothetical protein